VSAARTLPLRQVPISSIYASLLDPDEGASVEFVPATEISGKKCVKIGVKDVHPDIGFRDNAVICSVLVANPPFAVMDGFLK